MEQQFPAWVWIRIIQAAHKTHLKPTLRVCDSARLERGICILTFSKGFRYESSLEETPVIQRERSSKETNYDVVARDK